MNRDIINKLEQVINMIPTGETRNLLTEVNIELQAGMQQKEFKEKHFQYSGDLTKFINYHSINIIAITAAGKFSEGYILFYTENTLPWQVQPGKEVPTR